MTGGNLLWLLVYIGLPLVAAIGVILAVVSSKKEAKKVKQFLQTATPLKTPCKIKITCDCAVSEIALSKNAKGVYVFSINNGERKQINDYETIEFFTSVKENILTGYGDASVSKNTVIGKPFIDGMKFFSIDSPFVFEAVNGGVVRFSARPSFALGKGWKNNLAFTDNNGREIKL
jgi:hypothetical protein